MKSAEKMVFTDAVALVLALAVTTPFVANPNEAWDTRLVLLAVGMVGAGLSWRLTQGQRRMLRLVAVPGLTLVLLMAAVVVWDFARR